MQQGAAPVYGDLVARVLAARQGRSAKALVLDLDNTLWGGVIGDDGMAGITLGQGSALGEAHVSVQAYAHRLSQRGVILAVCSKNDDATAREPFEHHPDMVLRLSDDPALYAATIAAAGYFEAVGLTQEDTRRSAQYRANAERPTAHGQERHGARSLRKTRLLHRVASPRVAR